jgi:hypothetical protein
LMWAVQLFLIVHPFFLERKITYRKLILALLPYFY